MSLLGEARITPVAVGISGEIAITGLDTYAYTGGTAAATHGHAAIITYGFGRRVFTEGQRLAMIARDRGCSFPACDQPPARTQAHHITDYALTGRTTVG